MGNCILGMGVGKCSIPYTLPNGNAKSSVDSAAVLVVLGYPRLSYFKIYPLKEYFVLVIKFFFSIFISPALAILKIHSIFKYNCFLNTCMQARTTDYPICVL